MLPFNLLYYQSQFSSCFSRTSLGLGNKMATAVIITVGHSVAGKFYVLLMATSQKRVLEANTFL